MSMKFKYWVFDNQALRNHFIETPILSSVFAQTPYYFFVSSSNSYDLRIPSEFQSFSPYLNFPASKYSHKTAQCFTSIQRAGRWGLSPWFRLDPKFSSIYTRLYVCHVIQRSYLWTDFFRRRPEVSYWSGLNFLNLDRSVSPSGSVFWNYTRAWNPRLRAILDSMTESNLTKFGKLRKRPIRWPYNNFIRRFLKYFFTSKKTRRYKSIAATGIVGPYQIAYLLHKKRSATRLLQSPVKFLRRMKASVPPPIRRIFLDYNKFPSHVYKRLKRNRYRLRSRRFRNGLLNTKNLLMVSARFFQIQLRSSYILRKVRQQKLWSWFQQRLSMRRRAQGVQSKFSRTLPRVISRHVNVRLARAKSTKIVCRVTRQRGSIRAVDVYKIRRSKWIDAKRIEARRRWFKPTRRKEGPIPKFKAGFCLRYLQHHKFRLRARFVRLYTRILNFLNFVDRYWATFFRFFDFPVKFVAVRRNLYRFIRRWSKLRLPRRLSRIRSNRIIFRDFRMIQGRVGFQFSRVFHGLIRLYSHPTDFEYDILRLIAGVNIISACVSRSRAYGRLAIRNSLNFCRNYWYLVISTFWFRKQAYATAMISGCEIPVILRRLNCLIFTSSRISSLLMFSDYGAKLPLRVPKFYKFVGNYTRPPSRGLWEFCFVRPIRVNKI